MTKHKTSQKSKETLIYDDDYLKWCLRLSDEQRLRWLEEANRFIYEACPGNIWKMRMKARELGW